MKLNTQKGTSRLPVFNSSRSFSKIIVDFLEIIFTYLYMQQKLVILKDFMWNFKKLKLAQEITDANHS